jgi:hypothetical protein
MHSRPLLLVSLVALACACGSNEAEYNVRFAPGFSPVHHAVSAFGVYKDGQMSADAWESLAPRLSSWLGGATCSAGYVEGANASANAPLWTAVDDYTRSNGPTDDLLAELAPAAQGDVVMVVTVAGKLPEQEKGPARGTGQPSMSNAGGGMGGGMGGMRAGTSQPMHHDRMVPAGAKDALDLAALFYSTSAKTSVAEVSLEYTGHSFDDALAMFAAKIRESIPASSCAGWAWDGKVDPERIRKLGE